MSHDSNDTLNEDLVDELNNAMEKAINRVIQNHEDLDPRVEILTVLLSFASQVAQDMDIDDKTFTRICDQFYQESELAMQEELLEQKQLFPLSKKTNSDKPN